MMVGAGAAAHLLSARRVLGIIIMHRTPASLLVAHSAINPISLFALCHRLIGS